MITHYGNNFFRALRSVMATAEWKASGIFRILAAPSKAGRGRQLNSSFPGGNMRIQFGLWAIVVALAPPVFAANHVFVLSGGNDPAANHYSQYLQTHLLSESLKNRLNPNQVNVMFGAGNNETTPNILADVNH